MERILAPAEVDDFLLGVQRPSLPVALVATPKESKTSLVVERSKIINSFSSYLHDFRFRASVCCGVWEEERRLVAEDWKVYFTSTKLQGPTGAAGLGEDAESSVSSSVGPENRRPFVSERLA